MCNLSLIKEEEDTVGKLGAHPDYNILKIFDRLFPCVTYISQNMVLDRTGITIPYYVI